MAGLKLVEGRSNRRYTDENAVIQTVEAWLHPYEHNKRHHRHGKALGKAKFAELLGGLVENAR